MNKQISHIPIHEKRGFTGLLPPIVWMNFVDESGPLRRLRMSIQEHQYRDVNWEVPIRFE